MGSSHCAPQSCVMTQRTGAKATNLRNASIQVIIFDPVVWNVCIQKGLVLQSPPSPPPTQCKESSLKVSIPSILRYSSTVSIPSILWYSPTVSIPSILRSPPTVSIPPILLYHTRRQYRYPRYYYPHRQYRYPQYYYTIPADNVDILDTIFLIPADSIDTLDTESNLTPINDRRNILKVWNMEGNDVSYIVNFCYYFSSK